MVKLVILVFGLVLLEGFPSRAVCPVHATKVVCVAVERWPFAACPAAPLCALCPPAGLCVYDTPEWASLFLRGKKTHTARLPACIFALLRR
jgi:hypothetical protein